MRLAPGCLEVMYAGEINPIKPLNWKIRHLISLSFGFSHSLALRARNSNKRVNAILTLTKDSLFGRYNSRIMKKKNLEIGGTFASVLIFLLLLIAAKLFVPYAGYGYALALLIFVLIVGIIGVKLADISD